MENLKDKAWEIALKHDCAKPTWHKLAALRAKTHPRQVIPLYIKWIPEGIERLGNNGGYTQTVDYLKLLRPLMKAAHQENEFNELVGKLPMQYKPKRNLMKLLDRVVLF